MVFHVWKQRTHDGQTYVYVCHVSEGPGFTAPDKAAAHKLLWDAGYRDFSLMEMAYDPPKRTKQKEAA